MKALRFIGLLALVTTAWAAPSAKSLLSSAEAQAKKQHKNVLVIFHASWCGWCHKMDAMLERPEFKSKFAANYVIVHIDVLENKDKKDLENAGGEQMMNNFGGKNAGLPFWLVTNPRGAKLADSLAPTNIGYPAQPNEIKHFMDVLKKTAPKMTEADRSRLEAFLAKGNAG